MISVIIPIYNTRKDQLVRCLNSIINQPFKDLEIIIINDGNVYIDINELETINELDSRIQIFHQSNKGVSAARNTGINKAKGDWVAFVDGDDTVDKRFFEESMDLAKKHDADIVVGAMQYFYENNEFQEIVEDDTVFVFQGKEMRQFRRSHFNLQPRELTYNVQGTASAKLIRKELLNHIKFNTSIHYCEDQLFVRELLLLANKGIYIHHIWYHYYQYRDSSLHTEINKSGLEHITCNLEYLNLVNALNISEPDFEIRQFLCEYSMKKYLHAVNYWVFKEYDKTVGRLTTVKKIHKHLKMDEVMTICNIKMIQSPLKKGLYFLVKYRMFFSQLVVLSIYNLAHALYIKHKK